MLLFVNSSALCYLYRIYLPLPRPFRIMGEDNLIPIAMNKTQLVDAIAEEAGISKASSKVALDAVLKVIADSLKSGDEVSIVGFGAFKISERKARMGKNPRTHEPMEIPAKNVVKFKPGADLQL